MTNPARPWGTVSPGKAALRPAATMLGAGLAGDGIHVASITIAGQIQPGTPFSPDQTAAEAVMPAPHSVSAGVAPR